MIAPIVLENDVNSDLNVRIRFKRFTLDHLGFVLYFLGNMCEYQNLIRLGKVECAGGHERNLKI
jgi:hypothetical protein